MSLRIGNQESRFVTAWEVEDKGNFIKAQVSTGRKDTRSDSGYKNSSWNVIFLGDSKDKARGMQRGDKFKITNGYVENDYDKVAKKLYVNVTVFDFEFEEGFGNGSEDSGDCPY